MRDREKTPQESFNDVIALACALVMTSMGSLHARAGDGLPRTLARFESRRLTTLVLGAETDQDSSSAIDFDLAQTESSMKNRRARCPLGLSHGIHLKLLLQSCASR